jgi:hypothetical protein
MSFPLPSGNALRFNPPPNWPPLPPGWTPPTGWTPHPSWPPPPDGWQLWIVDSGVAGIIPGAHLSLGGSKQSVRSPRPTDKGVQYVAKVSAGLLAICLIASIIIAAANQDHAQAFFLAFFVMFVCLIPIVGGLLWRVAIRKNARRPVAIAIDMTLAGLCFLSAFAIPIGIYALARDSHYYGWWGAGDRTRPHRPWLGQHPQNPGKSWEDPQLVMANRQAVGNLAAQVAEYCAAYGRTFEQVTAANGTTRFVIDGQEYLPGEAAEKFLQWSFYHHVGRGYR